MSKIIVIVGPTAVGKTSLSIALAKKYDAEIINADATQVYQDANIGTAKVTKEEAKGIVHHMIDIVSLDESFTVKDYQYQARKILDDLIKQEKNVIIVGGSGLYTKALLYDYNFTEEERRISYDQMSNEELKAKVDSIYEDNNIHINNRKRLERFLSHYQVTGQIIHNKKEKDTPVYDFVLIGLTAKKDELNNMISLRVDKMIDEGLIKEASSLKDYKKTKSLIGYKEMISYLKGEISLEEAKELIVKNTKKYAKRQMTWYRNQFDNINWFETNYNNFNETIKKVEAFLKSL